jgi:Zn-dependent protease
MQAMSWADYKDRVRRYFPFSQTEWKNFLILVAVFAFMWSFTQWGETQFDARAGAKNFIIAFLMIGASVFVHHAGQRLAGLWHGYRVEHKLWWAGLLAGLLALMLTNGRVLIFAASAMQAHFMPYHRLGAHRYGPSLRQIGTTAFAGPIAAVVVAFALWAITQTPFFSDMLLFNLLFALYSVLPIPPLDGFHVFVGARTSYGSSFAYTFTVSAFIGFFLVYFLAGLGVFWSLLLALLIGLFGWFAFDVLVEKR